MAGPKQARSTAAAASRGGTSAKKDKGTRGGRPEAARPAAARPGPARRPTGQPGPRGSRPDGRAVTATATAVASQARPATRIAPLWFQLTTWALAIFGLGVSTYLTVAHYTSSSILACSDKGTVNCALVTTSPESVVFGVFPVAVLGLAFYVFLAAATSPWAWRLQYPVVAWARLASVIIGIVFVLYLIYTELFTLNAICLWCTSVHVITFLLFALIVTSAAMGYGFRDPDLAD
jgi:uncharacterized membrane protein